MQTKAPIYTDYKEFEVIAQTESRACSQLVEQILELKLRTCELIVPVN